MTLRERMEYLDALLAALGCSHKVKRGGILEVGT